VKVSRFESANAFVRHSARHLADPGVVAIWMWLWLRADRFGQVTVSQAQIAAELGVSRRTIMRHTLKLRDHGFLEVIEAGGNLNGARPNKYQLVPVVEHLIESQEPNNGDRSGTDKQKAIGDRSGQ